MPQKRITSKFSEAIDDFLLDRKAANRSPGTIEFYAEKLNKFMGFCYTHQVYKPQQITANTLRRYFLWLKDDVGHRPGGVHAHYRSVKAFVRWWALENDQMGHYRLFKRVKAPKVDIEILPTVSLDDVYAMIATCDDGWYGLRDRAIILVLLDTGVRASEFVSIDIEDVDWDTGATLIRKGKGRRDRTVFVGETAMQAVTQYLQERTSGPLWIIRTGGRLSYDGLRGVMTKCATRAGIDTPSLHSFRRAFALNMLRSGVDLETLRRLMGHTSLHVLMRYLALVDEDLKRAHAIASPVDRLQALIPL